MAQAKFSLSWDHYRNTICQGLSALQQNGEFVDMTLAADGYHVQVHKMVMSLASPYIKDLIATAQCPHPVIFLNNISYATLCSILEYVYTGETVVANDELRQLLEASKALHIQGLDKMINSPEVQMEPQINSNLKHGELMFVNPNDMEEDINGNNDELSFLDEHDAVSSDKQFDHIKPMSCSDPSASEIEKQSILENHCLQYTLSNHGNLQIVLNRYIYGLKYSGKKSRRLWRCVKHPKKRCPAFVVTRDNHILERKFAHNHPFDDQRILKKYSEGSIFEAIDDAENKIVNIKIQKAEMKRNANNNAKDIIE